MSRRVGFVLGDHGPSGFFRLALPCRTLRELGDSAFPAFGFEDFEAADILVFQRQHRSEAVAEILRWRARGKKIVMDFDDNFFQLDPHNVANKLYGPAEIADLKRLIENVDAVTVATQPLAEVYGQYNSNVFVLPNSLPEHAFKLTAEAAGRVLVGWQGSDSHHEDLKLLRGPLATLKRKYDFDIMLSGYNPKGLIKNAGLRPWIGFSPDLSYFQSFADFAIGLCPLARTPFNEGKSDLKWLEYSALAIPTVASTSAPYREIEDGATGLLARNSGDWEKKTAMLLADEGLRREIGLAARDYVLSKRTISANIGRWQAAYASL